MAVSFAGGVVMGADSRTTTGSYIANRTSDKITFVHDRVACCRSGSAADTQARCDACFASLSPPFIFFSPQKIVPNHVCCCSVILGHF